MSNATHETAPTEFVQVGGLRSIFPRHDSHSADRRGFSRNWGGMLAPEVVQYLLGCNELDEKLRRLLLPAERPA